MWRAGTEVLPAKPMCKNISDSTGHEDGEDEKDKVSDIPSRRYGRHIQSHKIGSNRKHITRKCGVQNGYRTALTWVVLINVNTAPIRTNMDYKRKLQGIDTERSP